MNSRTALGSCHILYSVKAEVCEVGNFTAHFTVPLRTECVSAVSHNNNSAEFFLKLVAWIENAFLSFNSFKNTVIVSHNTCKVNRNDNLCIVVDCRLHFIVVHFKASAFAVNHNRLCSHMVDD